MSDRETRENPQPSTERTPETGPYGLKRHRSGLESRGGRHRGLPAYLGGLADGRPESTSIASGTGCLAPGPPSGGSPSGPLGEDAGLHAWQRVVELAIPGRLPSHSLAPADLAAGGLSLARRPCKSPGSVLPTVPSLAALS